MKKHSENMTIPEGVSVEDFEKVLEEFKRIMRINIADIKKTMEKPSVIQDWYEGYLEGYSDAYINISILNNIRRNNL